MIKWVDRWMNEHYRQATKTTMALKKAACVVQLQVIHSEDLYWWDQW